MDNDNGVTNFHFEICADLLDDRTIALLTGARKGLFDFEIGIQSCNPQTLQAINRKENVYPVLYNTERLVKMGNIHVHVDLIAGLPYETYELFERSFNKVYDLKADALQLGFLKLLKGSGLRRDAEKLGIIFEPEAPYEVISTGEMSFEELNFLKDVEEVLEWYHNSGRYPSALRLLLEKKRPFELFAHLAREFREKGVLDTEKGERARAEALLEAGSELADEGMLSALIRHDLIALLLVLNALTQLSHVLARYDQDPLLLLLVDLRRVGKDDVKCVEDVAAHAAADNAVKACRLGVPVRPSPSDVDPPGEPRGSRRQPCTRDDLARQHDQRGLSGLRGLLFAASPVLAAGFGDQDRHDFLQHR
jgi:hypothetical protein